MHMPLISALQRLALCPFLICLLLDIVYKVPINDMHS